MQKYLTKKNTFNDFVDVAQCMVNAGVTTPSMLAIEGRSAGGLLMGAVINQRPGLFRACIAGVPFVDVMVTMRDTASDMFHELEARKADCEAAGIRSVSRIGDCVAPGPIAMAIHDGHRWAMEFGANE